LSAQYEQTIPHAHLEEFKVAPTQRDQVMQAARESDSSVFVSHVYQLRNNPETLLYLTDQLTIQFTEETDEEAIATIAAEFGLQIIKPVDAPIRSSFNSPLTPQKIRSKLPTDSWGVQKF
jgi:hypothetical protein